MKLQPMKIILAAVTLFLAVNTAVFAADTNNAPRSNAKRENERICNKEYKTEPVERAVCRAVGASAPRTRDCLINERQSTGARADNDTRKAEVERHAKCFAKEKGK